MIKVEPGKLYKTRDGRKARVFMNGRGIYSVWEGDRFLGNVFESTGTANHVHAGGADRPHDLIEEWKEEKTMFQVGKQYANRHNMPAVCLFADNKHIILRYVNNQALTLFNTDVPAQMKVAGDWKEYVEPKISTKDLLVMVDEGLDIWTQSTEGGFGEIIGKIRITYTEPMGGRREGSGIAVEVLEGDDTI